MILLALACCLQDDPAALLQTLEKADLTFFKVDPASGGTVPPGRRKLQSWAILQEKPLKDAAAAAVRGVLADKSSYGDTGAKCFTPGLAFRFKTETETVDFVVCLACFWVYVYRGDTKLHTWALSKEGVERLKGIYGNHATLEPKK